MASPSKQQLTVLLYGKLYLPALSLALLTGFTFSMSLSSALQALQLPAVESLFLVSLPHLWKASLSWVTPPCLFLLLNGIIMILTATSGSFSRPPPSSSSEFPSAKVEKFMCNDVVASTEPTSASASPSVPHSVGIAPPRIATSHLPFLQLEGAIAPLSHCCLHAQDTIMEELPEKVSDFHDMDYGDDDNTKEMQIISQEALQPTVDDTVIDGPEIDGSEDPSSSSCEEVSPKGGSEPSTPKYSSSSPAMKDNMRRSLSVDSAPCFDNVEDSPEYNMSEEAFRKRIEDYIFKVNAKLRSETRFL